MRYCVQKGFNDEAALVIQVLDLLSHVARCAEDGLANEPLCLRDHSCLHPQQFCDLVARVSVVNRR